MGYNKKSIYQAEEECRKVQELFTDQLDIYSYSGFPDDDTDEETQEQWRCNRKEQTQDGICNDCKYQLLFGCDLTFSLFPDDGFASYAFRYEQLDEVRVAAVCKAEVEISNYRYRDKQLRCQLE